MNLIELIQSKLLSEFENVGVTTASQFKLQFPKMQETYKTLCNYPEDLTTSEIKKMMQYLEIKKLTFENITIQWA